MENRFLDEQDQIIKDQKREKVVDFMNQKMEEYSENTSYAGAGFAAILCCELLMEMKNLKQEILELKLKIK